MILLISKTSDFQQTRVVFKELNIMFLKLEDRLNKTIRAKRRDLITEHNIILWGYTAVRAFSTLDVIRRYGLFLWRKSAATVV